MELPLSDTSELPSYGVDAVRGFLPAEDPLLRLPDDAYEPWERLAAELPDLVDRDEVRAAVQGLPQLDTAGLTTAAERERAFLLLSLVTNAYVFGSGRHAIVTTLPSNLAVPFCRIADEVGRPPIFSYPTIFHGWRLANPALGITFDNLVCLNTLSRNPSEHQFWRMLLAMEQIFAPAIGHVVAMRRALVAHEPEAVASELGRVLRVCEELKSFLVQMPSLCDIHGWVYGLVPFLSGWNEFSSHEALRDGLFYEGASPTRRKCNSATAAQSAIFMLLDGLVGVRHGSRTQPFLAYMKASLAPGHRTFIDELARGPSLRRYVAEHASVELIDRYCELAYMVTELRHTHFVVANEFLQRKYLEPQQQAFLSKMIGETRATVVALAEVRRRLTTSARRRSTPPATKRWTIAYASQSGTAALVATELVSLLRQHAPSGVAVELVGMDEYDVSMDLPSEAALVVVTSTFGDGEPPVMAQRFREAMLKLVTSGARHPVRYAVFGLGSSLFANFCGFARELDEWLEQLGGVRLATLMTRDATGERDDGFHAWRDALVESLRGATRPRAATGRSSDAALTGDRAARPPAVPTAHDVRADRPRLAGDVVAVLGGDAETASVVRHLTASGRYRVRIVESEARARRRGPLPVGCEVVVADAFDAAALVDALRGARAVFAAIDTFEIGEARERERGAHIVDAAASAGVEHFVWASMEPCEVPFRRAKADVATYARRRRLPLTELLPAIPYEVFATTCAPRRARDGAHVFFLPPGPAATEHCFYAGDDLGGWVLACIDAPGAYVGRAIPLCAERVCLEEVAAMYASVAGEDCRVEPMTFDQVVEVQAFGPLTHAVCEQWRYLVRRSAWRDPAASLAVYPAATRLRDWMARNESSLGARFRGPY